MNFELDDLGDDLKVDPVQYELMKAVMADDYENVIHAAAVALGKCNNPKCGCVHIELFDENHKQVARGLIPLDRVPDVIAEMQRLANEIKSA